MVIGLTGQTGAGKTSASKIFKDCGFYVIDADIVARQVVEPNTPCLIELSKHFGQVIIKPNGELNRKLLGSIVFQDKQKLKKLNDIIYPYITKKIQHIINNNTNKWILLDAPTLFESGADKLCDKKVAVIADKEIRMQRIIDRDGLSEEQAENRINSQYDDKFYIERCEYIINSNGTLEELHEEAMHVIQKIKEQVNCV